MDPRPLAAPADDPRDVTYFHRLDQKNGRCTQCGQKYPCPLLKDAEDVLFGRTRPNDPPRGEPSPHGGGA